MPQICIDSLQDATFEMRKWIEKMIVIMRKIKTLYKTLLRYNLVPRPRLMSGSGVQKGTDYLCIINPQHSQIGVPSMVFFNKSQCVLNFVPNL